MGDERHGDPWRRERRVTWVIVAIVAAVVVVGVVAMIVARRARPADGVATFRRQIDALSPEARRTVVDEVHRIDEQKDQRRRGR